MKINLIMAWVWILAGFLSGMALGMGFNKEKWLGGYTSHKRRLYRLGHISFFGLGILNFVLWLTFRGAADVTLSMLVASWAFVAGAVMMPICCVLMAHWPRLHMTFAAPVVSLITGAVLTLTTLLRL
jgi:hypothetical protein